MPQIDHIQDIDTLRQAARLLERENDRLHAKIRQLTEEISRLRGEEAGNAQKELAFLKELLRQRESALFGDSSERRRGPRSPSSGNGREKTGHGPRAQPELPMVEEFHDLEDRECPVCGGDLREMSGQTEDSEEITVVERRFILVKQRRRKYRCQCNASVVTAPGPDKLTPGGRYTPAFAVEVASSKYLDHLPLERQVKIMGREGLMVESQTLWDQLNVLAHHLQPTYEALGESVLSSPVVFADETWWRLMDGKAPKRWWVWGAASDDAVFYRIQDSRGKASAKTLLNGYEGIVMADGYGVYSALSRDGPSFRLVNCWTHARRKFVEIEESFPRESAEMVGLIGELYAVEDRLPRWDRSAGDDEQRVVLAERKKIRDEESRAIVDRIRNWIYEQRPLPRSGLGTAVSYLGDRWKGFTAFLEDPRVPLDNNAAERALRGIVLGRKNHYGSRSKRGTEVAAVFYTLFESAKLVGVEPKSYVLKATLEAIRRPGTVTLPESLLSQ
ncbi:MAG: IS66 family transposase [Candidatus Thorarchaeota archaeon]|jgi:transposase